MPHALIFTLSLVAQAPAEPFAGKAVADGDTNTVLRDRQPVKIRLHGVDVPEAGQLFGAASMYPRSSSRGGHHVATGGGRGSARACRHDAPSNIRPTPSRPAFGDMP